MDTYAAPTKYVSVVALPNGLSFEAVITVPPGAAYPDQLELSEVAQSGAASMSSQFARSVQARADDLPF